MSNTIYQKRADGVQERVYIPNDKSPNPLVECKRCHWIGREAELTAHELARATREEPADIQHTCPDCNMPEVEDLKDEDICEGCWDDKRYEDDDPDQTHCLNCLVTAAEYLAEPDR